MTAHRQHAQQEEQKARVRVRGGREAQARGRRGRTGGPGGLPRRWGASTLARTSPAAIDVAPSDEEEVPERDRREDPADRRADRHAEVDREAVDRERGLAARRLDGLGEERHRRRPERLGQHREDDRDRGDRDPPFREGIDEERRAREKQRGAHERHGAPLVREPARERSADDRRRRRRERG